MWPCRIDEPTTQEKNIQTKKKKDLSRQRRKRKEDNG
jgi:hypothetical protein